MRVTVTQIVVGELDLGKRQDELEIRGIIEIIQTTEF